MISIRMGGYYLNDKKLTRSELNDYITNLEAQVEMLEDAIEWSVKHGNSDAYKEYFVKVLEKLKELRSSPATQPEQMRGE